MLTTYEKEMLEKIDNGKQLNTEELCDLCHEYKIVDLIAGEDRRWFRSITCIVQLGDRFFSITYDKGLTECQENEYYNQPFEVEKHTTEKTIVVTEWLPKQYYTGVN